MKRSFLISILFIFSLAAGFALLWTPTASASSGTMSDTALTAAPPPVYDHPTTPERLIASYANAINRKEYLRAYNYWESPSKSFSDFKKDFKQTKSVVAIVRPPIVIEGAAGSLYAAVPTLWLERKTNGARVAYTACFTARRPNPGVVGHPTTWRIYAADITQALNAGGWPFLNACPDAQEIVNQLTKYDNATTPERLIASFFDAINRKQYHRAYDYWESPSRTFARFRRGFRRIKRIDPLVRVPVWVEGAAGSKYAEVHILQLVTYNSGRQRVYDACYTLRRIHLPDEPWKIQRVTRHRLPNGSGWWLARSCR